MTPMMTLLIPGVFLVTTYIHVYLLPHAWEPDIVITGLRGIPSHQPVVMFQTQTVESYAYLCSDQTNPNVAIHRSIEPLTPAWEPDIISL